MRRFDLITRPYDEITDLMNQFLDRGAPTGRGKAFSGMKIDVQEDEKAYIVEADMPGVAKEEVSLDLVDNYLVIDVEQKQESQREEKNYLHKERSYMSTRRTVHLGKASKEGIEAKLDNGVLTVTVPKNNGEVKTAIEIK